MLIFDTFFYVSMHAVIVNLKVQYGPKYPEELPELRLSAVEGINKANLMILQEMAIKEVSCILSFLSFFSDKGANAVCLFAHW